MQYMLLIYSGEAMNGFEDRSEAEQQAIMGEYRAIRDPRRQRRQPAAAG